MAEKSLSPLDIALVYLKAGLSTIPIRRDGSKAPVIAWRPYGPGTTETPSRLPTEAEARRWWSGSEPPGIALCNGAVSGGLEVIDFDHDADRIFPQWYELVEDEAPGIVARLSIVRTPGDGYHVWFRTPDIEVPGNQKLASEWAVDSATGKPVVHTLIETRGTGGYAIVPGSPPECHPSQRPYILQSGPSLSKVTSLSIEERDLLISCAMSFHQPPDENEQWRQTETTLRPGDDFSRRGPDFMKLLPEGWTFVREVGGKKILRRPGKEIGVSATIGCRSRKTGHELFYNFSTSTDPIEARSYTKFSLYALLHHGNDFSAAARQLASKGYGERRNGHRGSSSASPSSPSTDVKKEPWVVILEHLEQEYRPTFRRGDVIYSATEGREIKRSEALSGPSPALIEALRDALTCPLGDDERGKLSAVPKLYREWAPAAWKALLSKQQQEVEAEEVDATAEEGFRRLVATGLLSQVTIEVTHNKGRNDEDRRCERHSLIHWAKIFGRSKPQWQQVRSYLIWGRQPRNPEPPSDLVDICIRPDLHIQVGPRQLATMSTNMFGRLAARYGIGAPYRACQQRVILLDPSFVAELFTMPSDTLYEENDDMTDDSGP